MLTILLTAAIATDVRRHRIPNALVGYGLLMALLLAAASPTGEGYFAAAQPGGPGFVGGLLGAMTGFAVFLPLYALRAMGAGDVKLMTMLGGFLSPAGTAEAAVLTLAMGGIVSVVYGAWSGALRRAIGNVHFMIIDAATRAIGAQSLAIEPALVSAGKVPYAIAIAAGAAAHAALTRMGFSIF